MRNFTPFLLISVVGTIFFLFSLGCGPTIDSAEINSDLRMAKVKLANSHYKFGLEQLCLEQTSDAKQNLQTALKLAKQTGTAHLKAKIEAKLASITSSLPKSFLAGDKLPSFRLDDVYMNSGSITWNMGGSTTVIHGIKKEEGPHIHFGKNGWIRLQNGTRYICKTPKGCKVDWTNFVITEGKIEVYLSKNNK